MDRCAEQHAVEHAIISAIFPKRFCTLPQQHVQPVAIKIGEFRNKGGKPDRIGQRIAGEAMEQRRARTGLGDIAAGTLVVYSERPLSRPQLPDAEPRRCPVPLTLSEQRAVLGFAERQGELSPARVNELAALLAQPLHISAPKAVAELNGIARGLLGPT